MSESRPTAGWFRFALMVWAAVFLGISVRIIVDRPGHRSVFAIYAEAAQRWRGGTDLYPEEVRDTAFPLFRYSPPVAAALTPFTFGPLAFNEIAWRLLTGGLLLTALLRWVWVVLPRALSANEIGVWLLLVLALTASNWNNGQSNPLVLALLLAGTAAVIESRWNLAAACLAIACLFKVYPIALGLLLALLHPRRFLPRLVFALAVGLALPFLLQEPSYVARQYALWFDYLLREDRTSWNIQFGNTDFQLLYRVWIGPLDTQAYRAIELVMGIVMAVMCLAARGLGWSEPRQIAFLLGLACIWMTAFGPATESATYMLLAPTAAYAVLEMRVDRDRRVQSVLNLLPYLLLLSVQISGWVPGLIRAYNKLGPQPLAALLLLTWSAVELCCQRGEMPTVGKPRSRLIPAHSPTSLPSAR